VTIEVPVASEYKFVAKAGSQMLVDFDGVPGPDLGAVYGANTVIGSGPLSVTNTSTKLVEFDFGNFNGAGSTSLKLDGVPGPALHHRQHHRQRRWRDHPVR
jgi:hypothetical protein